jgi:L-glyceraldehyde 3-phosphate reductase
LDDKLGGDVQDRLRAFSALAHEAELSPAQLALAWILRNDAITSVITGATSTAQVESNLQAAEVRLDDELAQRVEELFPA